LHTHDLGSASLDAEHNFATFCCFEDSISDYFGEHSSSCFASVRCLVIETVQPEPEQPAKEHCALVTGLNVVQEQNFHLSVRLYCWSFEYSDLIAHLLMSYCPMIEQERMICRYLPMQQIRHLRLALICSG
jgi:hypothetical protein